MIYSICLNNYDTITVIERKDISVIRLSVLGQVEGDWAFLEEVLDISCDDLWPCAYRVLNFSDWLSLRDPIQLTSSNGESVHQVYLTDRVWSVDCRSELDCVSAKVIRVCRA